jgi:hypothetical protein
MRCQSPGFTHLSNRMTGKQSIRDLPRGRAPYHQEPDKIKIGDTGKISVGLDRSPTTRTARRSATRSPMSPPELIKTTQIRKGHRWLSAMARQHAPTRAAPPSVRLTHAAMPARGSAYGRAAWAPTCHTDEEAFASTTLLRHPFGV